MRSAPPDTSPPWIDAGLPRSRPTAFVELFCLRQLSRWLIPSSAEWPTLANVHLPALARHGALPAAPLPWDHLRLRRRSKAQRSGLSTPRRPTYIGTQLEGYANGTPAASSCGPRHSHPGVAGVGVAITEILIGLLVTAGLFTRIAAAGGMALNFFLFLTASWHTTPYFLGPDLVFTFAWLPFVLAGATGQPALDNATMHPSEAMVRRTRLRPESSEADPATPMSTRRTLLVEFGGIALAIAGISALVKGGYSAPRALSAGSGGCLQGSSEASDRRQRRGGGNGGSGRLTRRRVTQRSRAAPSSSAPGAAFPAARPPPTATPQMARRTSSSATPKATSKPSAPSAPTPAAPSAMKAAPSSAPATVASTAPKPAK